MVGLKTHVADKSYIQNTVKLHIKLFNNNCAIKMCKSSKQYTLSLIVFSNYVHVTQFTLHIYIDLNKWYFMF